MLPRDILQFEYKLLHKPCMFDVGRSLQITNVFLDGHSNPQVQIIGLKTTPLLEHLKVSYPLGALHYSSVSS